MFKLQIETYTTHILNAIFKQQPCQEYLFKFSVKKYSGDYLKSAILKLESLSESSNETYPVIEKRDFNTLQLVTMVNIALQLHDLHFFSNKCSSNDYKGISDRTYQKALLTLRTVSDPENSYEFSYVFEALTVALFTCTETEDKGLLSFIYDRFCTYCNYLPYSQNSSIPLLNLETDANFVLDSNTVYPMLSCWLQMHFDYFQNQKAYQVCIFPEKNDDRSQAALLLRLKFAIERRANLPVLQRILQLLAVHTHHSHDPMTSSLSEIINRISLMIPTNTALLITNLQNYRENNERELTKKKDDIQITLERSIAVNVRDSSRNISELGVDSKIQNLLLNIINVLQSSEMAEAEIEERMGISFKQLNQLLARLNPKHVLMKDSIIRDFMRIHAESSVQSAEKLLTIPDNIASYIEENLFKAHCLPVSEKKTTVN